MKYRPECDLASFKAFGGVGPDGGEQAIEGLGFVLLVG